MITEERKIRIMDMVRSDGFISVKEIMKIFNVSRSSAMRDLDELESQGLVVRQRGGASIVESKVMLSQFNEPPTREKERENSDKKRIICKYAASLVHDGDNIFIDSGTTVLYLMEYLINREVNIITPNTLLLSKVPKDFKGKVILLEGEVYFKSECVGGSITGMSIMKYHFDHAFLTTSGIDLENKEVSCFVIPFSQNKAMVLKRSDHAHLLVDSSKIGIKGLTTWAQFDDFDHIYIDPCKGIEGMDRIVICE